MTNANPLSANEQCQLNGDLFAPNPLSVARGGYLERGDTTTRTLDAWFFVQVLHSPDPGIRNDVHLVRRDGTPGYEAQPSPFALLCKKEPLVSWLPHEVRLLTSFCGRACPACLRAARPGNTDPDLVDFYVPVLQAQGWRWGVQLPGAVEPSLALVREPWLIVMTLPRVGASIVVCLPNSWNANQPRDLGGERFRFLVPIGVAVEWAATSELDDTTLLESVAQGGRG